MNQCMHKASDLVSIPSLQHIAKQLRCLILRGSHISGGLSLLTCEMGLRTTLNSALQFSVCKLKEIYNVYSWCLVIVRSVVLSFSPLF